MKMTRLEKSSVRLNHSKTCFLCLRVYCLEVVHRTETSWGSGLIFAFEDPTQHFSGPEGCQNCVFGYCPLSLTFCTQMNDISILVYGLSEILSLTDTP